MKPITRTCIVGAGSIGSLFAGHFGSVAESAVLTRRAEHAEDLNRNGLRAVSSTGSRGVAHRSG